MPKLLSDAFNLSSTAVFLLDAENALRLASSSGWNEQAHSAKEYHLSLDEDIVGLAVNKEKAIANTEPGVELKSALPETLSYASIPLRGRGHTFGALLLQSEAEEAFGAERVAIFQIFADQVALFLENAELLAQKESALEIERRAYGRISQRAWGELISSQNLGAYRRDEKGISVLPAKPFVPEDKEDEREQVPISIRGNVIGYIDAQKPKNRAWTASEKELLRTLTSRLEAAIDSARLYQDSQEQAERERIISEASSQVRESLDIEGVLGIAARELRNSLGAAEAEVWVSAEYLEDKKTTGEK